MEGTHTLYLPTAGGALVPTGYRHPIGLTSPSGVQLQAFLLALMGSGPAGMTFADISTT